MKNKLINSIAGVSLLMSGAVVSAADENFESEKSTVQENSATADKPVSEDAIAAMFKKLDVNHDGMIDKKEAKGNKDLIKDFKKIAKKGKLDKDGYQKWEKDRVARQIKNDGSRG